MQKAVGMAIEGDTVALQLCIERMAPVRKDTPVKFNLPDVKTAAQTTTSPRRALSSITFASALAALSQATALWWRSSARQVGPNRNFLHHNQLSGRSCAMPRTNALSPLLWLMQIVASVIEV